MWFGLTINLIFLFTCYKISKQYEKQIFNDFDDVHWGFIYCC